MENIISDATKRNWDRLSVNADGKLKSFANKQKSIKRIIPVEYIADDIIFDFIKEVSEVYGDLNIPDIIYHVATNLLQDANIYERNTVQEILRDFENQFSVKNLQIESKIPKFTKDSDILGGLYQSLLSEGDKNKKGSYYTPKEIVDDMLSEFELDEDSNFLDPCCGSGAFLTRVKTADPTKLYGIENDPIGAFISKINILLTYRDIEFVPNIICKDFLIANNLFENETKFDFIATNPPWGNKSKSVTNLINSKESFVQFFVKAYNLLKNEGQINFLFPESILNVKSHTIIRDFIISNHDLNEIHQYSSSFTGVMTNFISMNFKKGVTVTQIRVRSKMEEFYVSYSSFEHTKNKVFSLLKPQEEAVIKQVLDRSVYSLSNSQWALGIVTGNNKELLKSSEGPLLEKIYTGKEIEKFRLREAKKYVLYDRDSFQQVAKDEIYRADEKLVYKFVSNKLMFAYDDSASLFLNSANILIPNILGMSTKTVLAFLNSSLYQFIYEKLFGELKVLRGNLSELPFPQIDEETDKLLTSLVDEIIYDGKDKQEEIDNIVYGVFDLDSKRMPV